MKIYLKLYQYLNFKNNHITPDIIPNRNYLGIITHFAALYCD